MLYSAMAHKQHRILPSSWLISSPVSPWTDFECSACTARWKVKKMIDGCASCSYPLVRSVVASGCPHNRYPSSNPFVCSDTVPNIRSEDRQGVFESEWKQKENETWSGDLFQNRPVQDNVSYRCLQEPPGRSLGKLATLCSTSQVCSSHEATAGSVRCKEGNVSAAFLIECLRFEARCFSKFFFMHVIVFWCFLASEHPLLWDSTAFYLSKTCKGWLNGPFLLTSGLLVRAWGKPQHDQVASKRRPFFKCTWDTFHNRLHLDSICTLFTGSFVLSSRYSWQEIYGLFSLFYAASTPLAGTVVQSLDS